MKARYNLLCLLCWISLPVLSLAQDPSLIIHQDKVESIIRFLSDDALQGRKTGETGNWVAARYLAESFRSIGLETAPSMDSYFQTIHFQSIQPATRGELTIDTMSFSQESELIIMNAKDGMKEGDIIFAQHAWQSDLEDLDLNGKYVLSFMGTPEIQDAQSAIGLSAEKLKALKEKGALGLVEIYTGRVPFNILKNYLEGPRMHISEGTDESLTHLMINADLSSLTGSLETGTSLSFTLDTDGVKTKEMLSPNVVAVLEGQDPELKDEYILITAHYDHVGTSTSNGTSGQDTVFNGARDNSVGCAAILTTAEYLAENPPARSVMFVGFTAEEMGLLGSKHFSDHPPVPLEQIVFNLNSDGAGYNDTTVFTVIGLERTSMSGILQAAVESVGMQAVGDPAPEQNLFDRSDNVSFASKGIPAPTFSAGFTSFDAQIMKYYHQVGDEADSIDFHYITKFCIAFARAARDIANTSEEIIWMPGDKYEEAYDRLYSN